MSLVRAKRPGVSICQAAKAREARPNRDEREGCFTVSPRFLFSPSRRGGSRIVRRVLSVCGWRFAVPGSAADTEASSSAWFSFTLPSRRLPSGHAAWLLPCPPCAQAFDPSAPWGARPSTPRAATKRGTAVPLLGGEANPLPYADHKVSPDSFKALGL